MGNCVRSNDRLVTSHISRNERTVSDPFPSVFKEGWTRHQILSRSHLDLERPGWLSRNREAHLILLKLLTTPSAPLRNGIFLSVAQPPLLGKEGNALVLRTRLDVWDSTDDRPLFRAAERYVEL